MSPYVTRPSSIVFGFVCGCTAGLICGDPPAIIVIFSMIGCVIGVVVNEVVDCFKR